MEPSLPADAPAAPKLLDQVRARIRVKHYSIRTEDQYVFWIRRFILFHGKRHPRELGAAAVEAFLSDLAVNGRVAAATQSQALPAPRLPQRSPPSPKPRRQHPKPLPLPHPSPTRATRRG